MSTRLLCAWLPQDVMPCSWDWPSCQLCAFTVSECTISYIGSLLMTAIEPSAGKGADLICHENLFIFTFIFVYYSLEGPRHFTKQPWQQT